MYIRTFLITTETGSLNVHTVSNISNKITPASIVEREQMFNQCLNILQKEYLNEQTSISDK